MRQGRRARCAALPDYHTTDEAGAARTVRRPAGQAKSAHGGSRHAHRSGGGKMRFASARSAESIVSEKEDIVSSSALLYFNTPSQGERSFFNFSFSFFYSNSLPPFYSASPSVILLLFLPLYIKNFNAPKAQLYTPFRFSIRYSASLPSAIYQKF
jgi:hypothetical protein